MPASKADEKPSVSVNGAMELISSKSTASISNGSNACKDCNSNQFIFQIFRPKSLLVKTTDYCETTTSTESSVNVESSDHEHHSVLLKKDALTKMKKKEVSPCYYRFNEGMLQFLYNCAFIY